jgi:hypothetical protein
MLCLTFLLTVFNIPFLMIDDITIATINSVYDKEEKIETSLFVYQ